MTQYNPDNIMAKIIRGELSATKIFEDDAVLVIADIHPKAPIHWLAIPKDSYTSFHHFCATAPAEKVHHFFHTISTLAAAKGLDQHGYRVVSNHGAAACQSVEHCHLHILAGKQLQDSF